MKRIATILILSSLVFVNISWAADSEKATQAAIRTAYKMLGEFDGFKDSPKFLQCGFGCGDDNPGKKWAAKCKMLEEKGKKTGVSMPIYTTFAYMQTMGRDYALGKVEDAATMRRMIESTLKDYEE